MHRIVIGTAVALMVLAAPAADAMSDSGVDLGARVGYQSYSEGDDGSFMGGLFLRWPWHSVILSELAVMYHGESVGGADVEVIPIQLSAMLFFLRRDLRFSPYVQGGVGAYITRVIPDEGDSDSEWDLGWHLGAGLDYMLNDRVFVEADFRYIWLDVDFGGETVGEKLSNFDNWMGSAGIGFRL